MHIFYLTVTPCLASSFKFKEKKSGGNEITAIKNINEYYCNINPGNKFLTY